MKHYSPSKGSVVVALSARCLSYVTTVSLHACLTSFLGDDHVDGPQCALTEGFHFTELPQVLIELGEDLICAKRLHVDWS